MSCPCTVVFRKNGLIVGTGMGNLGLDPDFDPQITQAIGMALFEVKHLTGTDLEWDEAQMMGRRVSKTQYDALRARQAEERKAIFGR